MRISRNVKKKETYLKETYLKVTSRGSELEKCERTRKSKWPPRWPTSSWNAWTLRANSENSRLREAQVYRDVRCYLCRSHASFCSHAYLYAMLKSLLMSKAMCQLLLGSLRCSTGAVKGTGDGGFTQRPHPEICF